MSHKQARTILPTCVLPPSVMPQEQFRFGERLANEAMPLPTMLHFGGSRGGRAQHKATVRPQGLPQHLQDEFCMQWGGPEK